MSNDTGFRPLGTRVPKRVGISSSTSFNMIQAVGGSCISIISMVISASGAGTVVFKSDDTEIGRITFAAAGIVPLNRNADGWLETREGEKLFVGNADGLTLTGFATYIEV